MVYGLPTPQSQLDKYKVLVEVPPPLTTATFQQDFDRRCLTLAKQSTSYQESDSYFQQGDYANQNLDTEAVCYCVVRLSNGSIVDLTHDVLASLGAV
ncbi:hypothetical protein M231_04300 [Tremella mesenterica]|uniref:Uncharacterized protein n=1 Tax=Tremella mesenterica TaxID=5217 RepID=A0A4Q1BKT9_TREME|nr:hypothetical protein M231_04300 [Tremella mesenterica]